MLRSYVWYTVYDMVNFELLHRIKNLKFDFLIGIIKKFEIQIHILVCFTKKHIKISLLITNIVLFQRYNLYQVIYI